jgi:hypothetical protein
MLTAAAGRPRSIPATAIFTILPRDPDDLAPVIDHSSRRVPNITIFIGSR